MQQLIDLWHSLAPWHVAVALAALWVLVNAKKSRPDGELLRIAPFRRMLGVIMPTRNESVVYFDDFVKAEKLLEYIETVNKRYSVDITHCLVGAVARGVFENPPMNRFMIGGRLYHRRGVWLTFSMKRKKLDREAKLAAVKLDIPAGQTFEELCTRINGKINVERSGQKTYADKELGLFDLFPRPLLTGAFRLLRWLNYQNLLPASFIDNDGMYTSVFIANLGSLNMGAGYHHLFEWGTCPLFMMVGKIEDKPVVEDGKVVIRKLMHIRWTYDERIDDGLNARFGIDTVHRVLENPFVELGCVEADGSDKKALDRPRDESQGPAKTGASKGTAGEAA